MNTTTQNNIATDLFYKIRSRFTGLKLGADTGEITILPEEARFFDFDYMEGDTPVGHVSISLAEPNSMKIYFSHGITEEMDPAQKKDWYGFLKELRVFAKRRLLSFDTRDIAKDNLDRRDYEFLSKNTMDNTIGESAMNESMYGTTKTSYQKLLDTRLIIKHNKTLQDDQQPGARSRNIAALFVENQDGERFKYPFVHLAGARAMQRHIANGGVPYDGIGESIIQMSEEIAQLKNFGGYVNRNDLMNSQTNSIVERSTQALESTRKKIAKLSKQKHYESYKDNFVAHQSTMIPEEFEQEMIEKFTVKNFNENLKDAFPVIYRLMQEESDTLNYEDIVAEETVTCTACDGTGDGHNDRDCPKCDGHGKVIGNKKKKATEETNHLEPFENWVTELGEESDIDEEFCQEGDEGCVQCSDGKWRKTEAAQSNNSQDSETDQDSASANKSEKNKSIDVQEVAEFIHSFYDKNSNTFPKGPEGVCTMVGKRFGEQAENAARQMVERLAPQQTTENNPELEELSNLTQLAGVQHKEQ